MAKLMKFPELRQYSDYDCGACAIQSVLAYYGIDVREEDVVKLTGTTKRIGTPVKGFKKAAKKFGLKYKAGKMTTGMLKRYIDERKPVIISLQAWGNKKVKNWKKEWWGGHFVIPIGYDKKKIYFEDPACVVRTYLTFDELEKRWHDLDIDGKKHKKTEHWGIMFYGKKPALNSNKAVNMDWKSFDYKKGVYKEYKKIR